MARLQISDPTGSQKGWSVAQGYPGWQVLPGNAPLPAKHVNVNWVNCWSAGFSQLVVTEIVSAMARFHGAAPCCCGHPHEGHMPKENLRKKTLLICYIFIYILYYVVIQANSWSEKRMFQTFRLMMHANTGHYKADTPLCLHQSLLSRVWAQGGSPAVTDESTWHDLDPCTQYICQPLPLSFAMARVQPRLKPKFSMINESWKVWHSPA